MKGKRRIALSVLPILLILFLSVGSCTAQLSAPKSSSILYMYGLVFVMALVFLFLAFFQKSITLTPTFATVSMVCWFALAGLTFISFTTEAYIMSFLWFAIGAIVEVIGIVTTLGLLSAKKQADEFTL